MAIPSIFTDVFEKKLLREAITDMIEKLEAGAKEATARNDTLTALTLQREAEQQRQRLAYQNEDLEPGSEDAKQSNDLVMVLAQSFRSIKPLNIELIKKQWAALDAERITATSTAIIFDCGERGKVIITQTGISVRGALKDDPATTVLVMRHAKIHWGGQIIALQNSSKFKDKVAGDLLGVNVVNAEIPTGRAEEVLELRQKMQAAFDIIEGRSPSRPKMTKRETAPMGAVIAGKVVEDPASRRHLG